VALCRLCLRMRAQELPLWSPLALSSHRSDDSSANRPGLRQMQTVNARGAQARRGAFASSSPRTGQQYEVPNLRNLSFILRHFLGRCGSGSLKLHVQTGSHPEGLLQVEAEILEEIAR